MGGAPRSWQCEGNQIRVGDPRLTLHNCEPLERNGRDLHNCIKTFSISALALGALATGTITMSVARPPSDQSSSAGGYDSSSSSSGGPGSKFASGGSKTASSSGGASSSSGR